MWGLAKLKWPQVGKGDLVLVLLRLKDSACDTNLTSKWGLGLWKAHISSSMARHDGRMMIKDP